jgi:hypothetical protein
MFALPPAGLEPDFVALFDYWRRQAPEGRLPGRQHIDPIEMPRELLPRLMLLDVEPALDGPWFRVRLAGTKVVELLGREPRGRLVHQLGLAEAASLLTAIKSVASLGAPAIYSAPLALPNQRQVWARRLGLPLARDGATVDMVLASYLWRDAALAASPGLVIFERLSRKSPRLAATA